MFQFSYFTLFKMCIVTGIFFIIFLVIIALILERRYRKPRINDIISKSVFITGTDSGIGHLLALHLDKKGVKVYAGCYTEQGADVLKKAASSRLKVIKIDVTKIESILLAKKFIEEDLKPEEGKHPVIR